MLHPASPQLRRTRSVPLLSTSRCCSADKLVMRGRPCSMPAMMYSTNGLTNISASQTTWHAAAGAAAVTGTSAPLRSRVGYALRLEPRPTSTLRPHQASDWALAWPSCLWCVWRLTSVEQNLSIPVANEARLRQGFARQGSRMLTTGGRKHIVAPLNQLVDERYTVYYNVAASASGRKVGSVAKQRMSPKVKDDINAFLIAVATFVAGLAFYWFLQKTVEARSSYMGLWDAAERRQQPTAPADSASKSPVVSSCDRAKLQQLPERRTAAAAGMELPAPRNGCLAEDASPANAPAAGTTHPTAALEATATYVPGPIAGADDKPGHCSAQRLHAVSSRLSGPLNHRHANPGDQPMTATAAASAVSISAEDAATSCGTFELLGPAE